METSIKNPKNLTFLKVALGITLALLAIRFIFKDALPYFGFQETTFRHYWDVKWWLIGHITGGLLALIIGPLQFWTYFRNTYVSTHRLLGRIYLLSILFASGCAIYIIFELDYAQAWNWAVSLLGLVTAWLVTSFMAYRSIKKRRFQIHKEWMIRSYIVTFAFVSFRFLQELPSLLNMSGEVSRGATFIWLSWSIPLLIAEVALQWDKK